MQSYFLASCNLVNGNVVVVQQLSIPLVNQTPLISDSFSPMQKAPMSLDTTHDFVGAQSTSASIVVLGSTPSIVLSSNDKSAFTLFEDNPNYTALHNLHVASKSKEASIDDDFEIPPPPKYLKKKYDLARKFQMEWSTKCPSTEMVLASNGVLHMVHCCVCTKMGKKPYTMGPKLHTLLTHEKKKKH